MPAANNHGLTVLTNADSDPNADTTANLRLRRPVADDITNRFNDATSGNSHSRLFIRSRGPLTLVAAPAPSRACHV